MLARFVSLDVGHLAIGGGLDHVEVGLEQADSQQPVMVRRLVFGRNAQPLVIGIEGGSHSSHYRPNGHFRNSHQIDSPGNWRYDRCMRWTFQDLDSMAM